MLDDNLGRNHISLIPKAAKEMSRWKRKGNLFVIPVKPKFIIPNYIFLYFLCMHVFTLVL